MAEDDRISLYRQLHKRHTADEPQRIYTADRVLPHCKQKDQSQIPSSTSVAAEAFGWRSLLTSEPPGLLESRASGFNPKPAT